MRILEDVQLMGLLLLVLEGVRSGAIRILSTCCGHAFLGKC